MREIIIAVDKIAANVAFIALFIILASVLTKLITKRIGVKEFDIQLMKIHKTVTNILFTAGIIHMCTSFVYFSELGIVPYIIGTSLLGTTICLVSLINFIIYPPIHKISLH